MLEFLIAAFVIALLFVPTVLAKRKQPSAEIVLVDGKISRFEPQNTYLDYVAGTIFVQTEDLEELEVDCILPWPEPPAKGTRVKFEDSAIGMLRSDDWLSDPTEFAGLLAARLNTEPRKTEYFLEVSTTGLAIRVFDDGWLNIEIDAQGPDWLDEDEELDIGTHVEGLHVEGLVEDGVRYLRWTLDSEAPLESTDMLPPAFVHAVKSLTEVSFVEFSITNSSVELDIELVFMDVNLTLAIAEELQAAADFKTAARSPDDSQDAIW